MDEISTIGVRFALLEPVAQRAHYCEERFPDTWD